MPSRRALVDLALVALTRALLSVAWLASGFRAISDDDYSRVTIAARFAAEPSLDPSGTSWLPLPFWLYGIPMSLFGDGLGTARGVAFVLGVLSAVLVWGAARVFGFSARQALWGALLAALLPYGSWLSVATVPEAPTAALILFGAAALVRPESQLRLGGGLALGAACFCRYDAWAPALAFAICSALEARRQRRPALWLASALAAGPILLWLLHGLVRHGDALFFLARVTQYRAALGGAPTSFGEALLQTPWALLRFEPELLAALVVVLVLSWRRGPLGLPAHAWRSGLVLGMLLLLLIAADAGGGAATHHPERSLLPVFWGLALLTGALATRLLQAPSRPLLGLGLAAPLALAGYLWVRPNVRPSFAERGAEEQLGRALRQRGAQRVALDTDDYGYFAVQAALGYGKAWPLADLDPRRPRATRPSTSSALERRLGQERAEWWVTTRKRAELAAPFGAPILRSADLIAVQLRGPGRERP